MKRIDYFEKSFLRKSLIVGLLSASVIFGAFAKGNSSALSAQPRGTYDTDKGVYYSIFVRSFADSDGDGIGDFNGLTSKLDYLNDGNDKTTTDLGVTGIWLLPIYESHSYHGYDVDNYYEVNSDYGTMQDFERLISECKKRGISVILDMTVNHSSYYNNWFQKSRNPENPEHNWYRWTTADANEFDLNSQIWGHKIWNEDSGRKGNYYCGLFGDHMPDFNLDCPELREEFKNVMKFWLEKGVTGFRYDAAGHVYNAIKIKEKTESVKKANEFFEELMAFNKSVNPNSYSVGEVWENSATRANYAPGLGSDFHFDLGDKIILASVTGNDTNNGFAFAMKMDYDRLREKSENFVDAPFLSNHDQVRTMSRVHNDENAKICATAYLTMEGLPFMYYGEEIGMRSGDPDETKRTPLLWGNNDAKQCSWEADEYNTNTVSIADQQKDSSSLLNYYKRLIRLRLSHPSLYEGKFKLESVKNRNISSWKMESEKEDAFIMLNVTENNETFVLDSSFEGYTVSFMSNDSVKVTLSKKGEYEIVLPAKQSIVITKNR